ncbi:MAG: hypothetical protein E4G94_02700, partial [ANME-2 cluster archaeon]
MNDNELSYNVGVDGYRKRELKKSTHKYILFLLIFLITIAPSIADSIHENEILENSTCIDCHPDHQTININSESPQISTLNPAQVLMVDSIQSFATSNVVGNITLIASLGQNWYQQGIYGLSSSSSLDQSWGWTFFDENPPSGFIVPFEKITQKNNIYALLLDDGNNSNPISGADVVANVTYWIFNGTGYASNIISVQLTEDINSRGFYNGIFSFYGGTTYGNYGMNNCDGCHPTAYHGSFQDTLAGYFPGNYTVSIKAEADNKIKMMETNFEVTPWGCEDCHGSGNQHNYAGSIDSDSACYVCHGVTQIGYHSAYKAGNPHQNTAHREILCTDCHTNKSINSQTFNGVTFVDEKPQYDYDVVQLNSGTHSNLACIDCHRDLTLSDPQGNYKPDNYAINNVINRFDLSFTSIQQFQDNYIVNVTQGETLSISFDWEGTSNLGFYLYPPNFNPRNLTGIPYNNGANISKPETYINTAPMPGKWILSPYGYNLGTRSGMVSLFGTLQSPINYTISSTYPIEQNNLPLIPECNECHNSSASGGAYTEYEIPDWNPGFAHVDTNNDATLDIQCRMCHNAMHDITVIDCQKCHTVAPPNHPTLIPEFNNNTPSQCLSCHGDPHEVTGGGGPDCIACHDIGDDAIHLVDVAVINSGIHGLLNNKTGNPNEACWGCHQTNGTEPTGMGDRYNTPYICTDCHLESSVDAGIYGALIVVEHFKNGHDILAVTGAQNNVSSCLSCHQNISAMILDNDDVEPGTFDTDGNGVFGGPTNPYHYGKKRTDMRSANETNCSYCHQNISEFNEVFADENLTDITHDGDKNCYTCHREQGSTDGKIHDSSLLGGGGGACIECHKPGGSGPVVDVIDLGGHINLNTSGGNDNLTSEDCMTCHFDNPHSGPDATNTHYCAACHTAAGSGPNKSTILFEENKHGRTLCVDCHLADGTYHQDNPRGSVANTLYVNRYNPGDANITDCVDCHYSSNLDDAPFHAPGAGSNITNFNINVCASCHDGDGESTIIGTI